MTEMLKAWYHLPGLFEFEALYRVFLPLYREHREYFYDWCEIGSIYGAPSGCLWGGGRVTDGDADPRRVLALTRDHGISPRLTFSNLLLREEHLADRRCNALCDLFAHSGGPQAGVIVGSELLTRYLRERRPELYLVSSTTKTITDFDACARELDREEFRYVVPDFRLNMVPDRWRALTERQRGKAELLCNECCWTGCADRRRCYEDVSRRALGEDGPEHLCRAPGGGEGYRFSRAMESPAFISTDAILDTWLPMGVTQFKLEGRGLGSAVVLEMLLYYMTRPEHRLRVREEIYLDGMLDLF